MDDEFTYGYKALIQAIGDFLRTYVRPAVNSDCVLLANMPDMVLPEDNDYIIFQVMNTIRHGTTHELYDPDGETVTLTETAEAVIKVDCYGVTATDDTTDDALMRAQIRAHNIETIFRSSVATQFFKAYNIQPLYADNPSDTTIVSDSNNYLHRWTVMLHVNYANTFTVPQPGFTEMAIKTNDIVTQAEAEQDPISAGRLHFADADVFLDK